MEYNIFIVDDEVLIRKSLQMALKREDFHIEAFETAEDALSALEDFHHRYEENDSGAAAIYPDLMLLDIKLPGMDGIELLKKVKQISPDTLVIMITAHGTVEAAVEALKFGAYDFFLKPFSNEQLRLTVQRALDTIALKKEVLFLRREMARDFQRSRIIGSGPSMKKLLTLAQKIAASGSSTVLIEGESGTGKGLLARTIHFNSERFQAPFVTINCSAIPRDLLESELFGYEKGAFSGASPMGRIGKLEAAQGGTLFLDEIGDMDISLQAKILHAVEEHTITRVGGIKPIITDVRIIAASNKNLNEYVKKGLFRGDLFHRLNVIHLVLPPLKEREEDILPLAYYFLDEYNKEWKKKKQGFSAGAQKKLKQYHWPGNIRELRNVIERAIVLDENDYITEEYLMLESQRESEPGGQIDPNIPKQGINLEEVERAYLIKALKLTQGNQRQSAKLLGLEIGALRYRLKKFNLSPQNYQTDHTIIVSNDHKI